MPYKPRFLISDELLEQCAKRIVYLDQPPYASKPGFKHELWRNQISTLFTKEGISGLIHLQDDFYPENGRGFTFATFSSPEEAEKAYNMLKDLPPWRPHVVHSKKDTVMKVYRPPRPLVAQLTDQSRPRPSFSSLHPPTGPRFQMNKGNQNYGRDNNDRHRRSRTRSRSRSRSRSASPPASSSRYRSSRPAAELSTSSSQASTSMWPNRMGSQSNGVQSGANSQPLGPAKATQSPTQPRAHRSSLASLISTPTAPAASAQPLTPSLTSSLASLSYATPTAPAQTSAPAPAAASTNDIVSNLIIMKLRQDLHTTESQINTLTQQMDTYRKRLDACQDEVGAEVSKRKTAEDSLARLEKSLKEERTRADTERAKRIRMEEQLRQAKLSTLSSSTSSSDAERALRREIDELIAAREDADRAHERERTLREVADRQLSAATSVAASMRKSTEELENRIRLLEEQNRRSSFAPKVADAFSLLDRLGSPITK